MNIKISNFIYIVIIILQVLLINEYNLKEKEKDNIIIEQNNISYILNEGKKYNIKKYINDYEMILEIPIIKLKKGILSKDNKDNNIDKNVTILQESSYPNQDGNIYLAAHSGNGNKSYFNKIKNLKVNNIANLYYREIKYIYKVIDIKEINKNNKLTLNLNSKNNLVLITCSQSNKSKYLIVILEKIKETDY